VQVQPQPDVGLPVISYATTVRKVEEKRRLVRAYKTGRKTEDGKDEIQEEWETVGWGVLLEGEWEWKIFKERPPLEAGDRVRVTIEPSPSS